MKQSHSKRILLFSLLFGFLSILTLSAQSNVVWTKEKAAVWFHQSNWLNGLKLYPHKTTNQIEFAKQYHANKAAWDQAFAFLKMNHSDSLKTGNYVIAGDTVFADVTDNPSSELNDAKWHSHRQYCDIMYIVKGKETTGIAPLAGAAVLIPFGQKGDSQFYKQDMKGNYYVSNPDTFLILFPSDVHRPFIKTEGCSYVKRIRIKIRSK